MMIASPATMYHGRPLTKKLYSMDTMRGVLERMFAKRMSEIPFPIPNSLIFSAIHITSAEPAE